ncbi:MAG: hypothetical protein LH609_12295 [Rudanella sp.]|nr:hypothetical protein [Rudanella sp.]
MRYLRRALDASHPTDEPYVLNEVEAWVIRRVRWRTMALAAGLGVVVVLLYFLPHYFWPAFFEDFILTIKGAAYTLPAISILYGILLIYVEVHALMYINLNAIRTIMAICQFPRVHDAQYDQHLRIIAKAAFNVPYTSLFASQADTHFGRPGWGLPSFFWINMGKAMLIFSAIQALLIRLISSIFFRQVASVISMPVFAFWNVFASFRILREAQIRVMAPLTIHSFVDELYEEWGKHEQFRKLVPAVLSCVGIQKRHYNYAHHLLAEAIEHRFDIQLDAPDNQILSDSSTLPAEVRTGLERLIIFATLVDGRLSLSEKKCLQCLRTKGIITYTLADIQQIGRQYNEGKGLWV